MKRNVYQLKAGSIGNLKRVEDELAAPGAGEVTIAVKAIGLNFADIFAMFGLYSATPAGVFTPGLEYAGVVAKVGEGVRQFKEGDEVMGVTNFGAYTTHLNIDEGHIIPLPKGWSMAEGAAYLVQGLTAYYGLFNLGNLQEGYTVLIHSAAGGVGTLANRMCKKMGCYTIGTVSGEHKFDYLQKEGYDAWIKRGPDFQQKLNSALGGRELNLIMECIGGKILSIGYKTLAPEGRMIIYGAARYASPGKRPNYLKLLKEHITRPKLDPQTMAEDNKGMLGFNLIYLYDRVKLMHQLLDQMKTLDIGKPYVGHEFTFNELPKAIQTFQSGKTMGKVVVKISNA